VVQQEVVQGLYVKSQPPQQHPCYVIAESWPGWMAVLPLSSFHCTKLFVSDVTSAWVSTLRPTGSPTVIVPLHSLPNHAPPSWCFIQGSIQLLDAIPTSWRLHSTIVASLSCHFSPPEGWFGLAYSHLDLGGGGGH
jgi:hypothetical protein